MLNIERYKNELDTKTTELEFEIQLLMGNKPSCDKRSCRICRKECIEWLLSEYKEPVLTEEERKYLKGVIRPFRNKVLNIQKKSNYLEWISIVMTDHEIIKLPFFDKSSGMYKGMQLGIEYTLEELGL